MATLERAIEIAARAHSGQKDKAGVPYILHPLRLMLRLSSNESRIVAMLHDVVEDSTVTLDDLKKEGFTEHVLAAIESLSRRESENYDGFIDRVAQNPLAREVKMEDLKDNMDLSRLGRDPREQDLERQAKYKRALTKLKACEEPQPRPAKPVHRPPYSVLILDLFHRDPEEDYTIDGFPSLELANEYARRRVRDSVEEMRRPGQTKEELRGAWSAYGQDAIVVGGEYAGGRELDFFIEHPATAEERDWQAIKAKAGISR